MRRLRNRERLLLVALASAWMTSTAFAQDEVLTSAEADVESDDLARSTPWPLAPVFDKTPGWSIGLDAYAGLALLTTAGGSHAHGIFGGLSRFQWKHFQAGAVLEASDPGEGQWRSIGGFVGAFVPFRHWVDFEFAGGLTARTYRDSSPRYGPDGYEATTPALTVRAGFSDRSTDSLFGLRLGGHLAAAFDFERDERSWRYDFETTSGEIRSVVGETPVGGYSIALAITAGFDIGQRPRRPQ